MIFKISKMSSTLSFLQLEEAVLDTKYLVVFLMNDVYSELFL